MYRQDAVQKIKSAGKYEAFIKVFQRTPEEYFAEYADKEPEIWQWVLNDLGIGRALEEMTTTSGGGGSSAGTPGYQIPGAWAGGSLEKNKKHIEVLGYTLTDAGKKEMKRAGDNLYEGVQSEASGLGRDFDRAQAQYDAQLPPEDNGEDGIECPKCKAHSGHITDRGTKGSSYWYECRCNKCGATWGDDNFEASEPLR